MRHLKYPLISSMIAVLFGVFLITIFMYGTGRTQSYLCGDANGDAVRNVGDAVYIVAYIFKGGPAPEPPVAADVNADGSINIGDAVYLIDWIFRGGPEPICEREGELIGYTGCKMNDAMGPADSISNTEDCLAYRYDSTHTLAITHINAGFNCCPIEMVVTFRFPGDTVVIDETGIDGLCDCECLFDLDLAVRGLAPGQYVIQVLEPDRHPDDPPLVFTVDLTGPVSGMFCVPRNYYPWGY